ncbi:DNRLRE domain-containing protein, partial [candidate division KSB1 bacterium]|nr:DNRLRE domain-containing protein [candidate division KSB1 bacterium]
MKNVETKMSKIAMAVIALLVVTVFSYGQSEVQIPAKMDNTLYEDASGELSNGAGQSFFVGRTNQTENSIRRGLIAFDISGNIPANAVIQDVMLTLSMSKTSSGAEDIMLHRVLAEWGEGTSDASGNEGSGTAATTSDATWTYRMYNTELWDTQGGDFALTSSATLSVDNAGSYTWGSTQQMVDDVQGWLDNPSENFGWILVGNESSSRTSKRFDSHEHPTASSRPVLSVTYTTVRETAVIDRFSEDAGNLFVRDDTNGLPGPNEPIDFDMAPFITKGLGPNGEFISYYNFDVQPTVPAPIYVLFREGEDAPVAGQMNIIDVVPGDEGYNDFWHV